jgi:hypothetical protein
MQVGEIIVMLTKTLTAASAAEVISHSAIISRVVKDATERVERVADFLEELEKSIKEDIDEVPV